MIYPSSAGLLLNQSLPPFELAAEEALADFLVAACGGTGGPLAGVRVLAGVRDYDVCADAEDTPSADPSRDGRFRGQNALKPRLTIAGSGYERGTNQDRCVIETIITVNGKHHTRAIFGALVNHIRALFSTSASSELCASFNAWSLEIGTSGYKLFIQGIMSAAPSINGFDDTSLVCRQRYTVTGGFIAV